MVVSRLFGREWDLTPVATHPLLLERASGILLHPTSLPGRFGVGTLGADARRFADMLAVAHQRIWQVLPLGPTGFGDSPYQCLSAFAGNPLLIDLDTLVDMGLLDGADLAQVPEFPRDTVDFGAALYYKRRLLTRVADTFARRASPAIRDASDAFCDAHASWLDDFALYAAVKQAHDQRAWVEWEPAIAAREPAALDTWRRRLAPEVHAAKLAQFLFFEQWHALRAYCRARGVAIMGDAPIFVAHDSADVWTSREQFQLGPDGRPAVVAGVPPDYFSATGQLWGNPLYRWDVMAADGYRWWIARLQATFDLFDLVRLDHFRGFEAYWEIPGGATTAIDGRWVTGPGAALFDAVRGALGDLPIIAENLGVITPEVEALRHRFGFPGMAILQFAFGTDPQAPTFRPHNLARDVVAFTGTHDNDTIVGWWTATDTGHSTRTPDDVARERQYAQRYLGAEGQDIHWAFIRAALASVAKLTIFPLQDVLGVGSEGRMNVPARPTGNWRWRCRWELATEPAMRRLADLTEIYDRVPAAR